MSHFVCRCMTHLFAVLLILLSPPVLAVVQCPVSDHSFRGFLQRFEEDPEFRQRRLVLPLVARLGEYTMTDVTIELWNVNKMRSLDYPLILNRQGRKQEHVTEIIMLLTKRYAEVFHDGPPESDLYRMLYKFRSIGGCWFLEEVHDKSE